VCDVIVIHDSRKKQTDTLYLIIIAAISRELVLIDSTLSPLLPH